MNFKQAKLHCRNLGHGMTLRKIDGEYRVNYRYGDEATAYYTNDLADAISTAESMVTSAPPSSDPLDEVKKFINGEPSTFIGQPS